MSPLAWLKQRPRLVTVLVAILVIASVVVIWMLDHAHIDV